ncbi:DUF2267 domain-containing protein [Sinorhizobium mexicanum]|uniref:DUF2267 domain-containing protein n=1 Tax=Sinorhizobium mexicanum TaxID=375549 RepID=A0A859QJE4_9HYPH|nr:DUF2267 domain-containing protein [Sinorhizobium mexicanum]MBP1884329.1 uncharacterized protein (DUF2267 family) [Sinorhizobium mexicanum]QLL65014.1 DUF2267 domain-containing protein [Sinorhizobium mexicanum]
MSPSGVATFDKTLQVTNTWLDDIMKQQGPDRQAAWHILGAVLHTIRDRLPTDLSAHLAAQLPLLVRGAYYEQYQPSKQPAQLHSLDEFLDQVKEELAFTRPVDAKDAVQTVFAVLSHYLDPGQIAKVRESLPQDIRALWPDPLSRH